MALKNTNEVILKNMQHPDAVNRPQYLGKRSIQNNSDQSSAPFQI